MKDQYFGDINDYRKYGLLRAIVRATGLRLLVAWMLTPDDGSKDGRLVSYLEHPDKWSRYDPELYRAMKEWLESGSERRVRLIETTCLLPGAAYFSHKVPDTALSRGNWFDALADQATACSMVFLDPDNGLEVKSVPYGRRNSSKYLYWREVAALWAAGKSLLIYQHFIREERVKFVQRLLLALCGASPGASVEAFRTPHVVFLLTRHS